MFRALLAFSQEAIHKQHLVYCLRFAQSWCSQLTTRTQYTKCRLCSDSWGWISNARNMQRPLILNKQNKKCITLVSLYWYTMMCGQQNVELVFFPLVLYVLKVRPLSGKRFSSKSEGFAWFCYKEAVKFSESSCEGIYVLLTITATYFHFTSKRKQPKYGLCLCL
jgi:hypothetical protein